MNSLSTAYLLLSALGGMLGGGVVLLIGVWGVEKLQNRRLFDLEEDVEDLRARHKSFQKTMSGRLGQEKKQQYASVEQEARELLKQSGGVSDDAAWINGGH